MIIVFGTLNIPPYNFTTNQSVYRHPGHLIKQLKQILQKKHNVVKNSNWQGGANQLAIYRCSQRIWNLGTTVKQIHVVLRVGFEPGTYGLEVQHSNQVLSHAALQDLCYT